MKQSCRWIPAVSTLVITALTMAGSIAFAESPAELKPAYPLWNGSEAVTEYARRANLPPAQTLDLGNGVKLELVLIPAGKFIMGTPDPEKPALGQTMVGISGGVLLVAMVMLLVRARRK